MHNQRRSIRLRDYDYRQAGGYFLTLCTLHRACIFGETKDGEVRPSAIGEIVAASWEQTAELRPTVALDAFVLMPNHLHGIVFILRDPPDDATAVEARAFQSPARTIGALVRGFKASVTRQVGMPIWQRNYYEHVIRNDRDLDRIRRYIEDNPAAWDADAENPKRPPRAL